MPWLLQQLPYRGATVLFSMSVTFGLPVLVRFLSNTCFICQHPWFLLQHISSVCCRRLLCMRCTNEVGEGGVTWVTNNCLRILTEIIMARDLMCQIEARCQVPVRIPVPQGTGESSYTDHVLVWTCNRNYDLTANPSSRVRNGFIHFRCHESTKISEYDQGLLSKNAINRKKKRIKMFPFILAVLTMIILLLFLPISQELIYWIKPVDICTRFAKFDVNYGVSMYRISSHTSLWVQWQGLLCCR